MHTPATIARHPIHVMLIGIPIGLWLFSFVCDVVVVVTDIDEVANLWFTIGFYTMAAGLAGALLAAIPGFIDFLSIKNREIRRIGATHMTLNLIVVAAYVVNLWLRTDEPPLFLAGMALSLFALCMLTVSAWLGGEMVHVHGVGVEGVPGPISDTELAKMYTEPSTTRMWHRHGHGHGHT
jgi:uncharacterized membrane protein